MTRPRPRLTQEERLARCQGCSASSLTCRTLIRRHGGSCCVICRHLTPEADEHAARCPDCGVPADACRTLTRHHDEPCCQACAHPPDDDRPPEEES